MGKTRSRSRYHIHTGIYHRFVREKKRQEVKVGDLLCLLEAMKMHNKIQAPISGTVTKIHVNKGDKLPKDALMFEIK